MANHNVYYREIERARYTHRINVADDDGGKEEKRIEKKRRKPNSNSQNTFSRLNRNGLIKSCEKNRNLGEQFSKATTKNNNIAKRIEKKAHAEHT